MLVFPCDHHMPVMPPRFAPIIPKTQISSKNPKLGPRGADSLTSCASSRDGPTSSFRSYTEILLCIPTKTSSKIRQSDEADEIPWKGSSAQLRQLAVVNSHVVHAEIKANRTVKTNHDTRSKDLNTTFQHWDTITSLNLHYKHRDEGLKRACSIDLVWFIQFLT